MRATLICLHYPPEPSGNAPYSGALAEGLAARGMDVQVVTGLPHYPQWRVYDGFEKGGTELRNGVPVTRHRHPVPTNPRLTSRLGMELAFGFRALTANWHKPDVVVLVSPALFSSMLVAVRAVLSRRPFVVWVQDFYSLGAAEAGQAGALQSRLLAAAERLLFSRARAVVVIHERFKRSVVTRIRVDPAKVVVIRNWSHVEEFAEESLDTRSLMRQELGWPDDVTVVLHAGNMGVKQGLPNVVEAAKIADRDNQPLLFVLMGDGNQRAALEAMATATCLQFLDPVPQELFTAALGAADVLLVNERPGVKDMSVPSKLTSYFATGLPIVASTDSGSVTAEEIEASRAGIRVDADRPELIVGAAMELRNNAPISRALGRNGLEFRRSNLSADSSIDSFHELLVKLAMNSLGGRDGSHRDGGSATEQGKATEHV
jgi:putative colanic acid biosynthesis glycosyltransferase WcaI